MNPSFASKAIAANNVARNARRFVQPAARPFASHPSQRTPTAQPSAHNATRIVERFYPVLALR